MPESRKVLIVGAGDAGRFLIDNLRLRKNLSIDVVGFVDDSFSGQEIRGVRVLGGLSDLRALTTNSHIDELWIAIPSEHGAIVRQIIRNTWQARLEYKILPSTPDVFQEDDEGDFTQYLRRVTVTDLLGGTISKQSQAELAKSMSGQRVLITGAAGSIGSELARQVASLDPEQVILYDWSETGMFEVRNELIARGRSDNVKYVLGDIKDRFRLRVLADEMKPTVVFHAAAYKHVPLMEDNPSEAVKNNLFGTQCVAEAAIHAGASSFVLVSTDKAVNPTSVMGATKRAAEQMVDVLGATQTSTCFMSVRFGNVINSNGSVVPIFQRQIESGGPVTVTHPEINRYFMTIPDAVHLILQAWTHGENGDLFVLDMGDPVLIQDLARLQIAVNGYVPDQDIEVTFTGLRPGEKLYEEVLVAEEESDATPIEKVFRTRNHMDFDRAEFLLGAHQIIEDAMSNVCTAEEIRVQLRKIVRTYQQTTH